MFRNKALLVGFRASNFSQKMLHSDRLYFWHQADPTTDRKSHLPADISVVILIQRFCSKKIADKIRGMLEPGVTLVASLKGTGQVRKYIEENGYVLAEETPVKQAGIGDVTANGKAKATSKTYRRLARPSMQLAEIVLPVDEKGENEGNIAELAPTPPIQGDTTQKPVPVFQESLDFINLGLQELLSTHRAAIERNTELEKRVAEFPTLLQQQKSEAQSLLQQNQLASDAQKTELEALRDRKKQFDHQAMELSKLRESRAMWIAEKVELQELRAIIAKLHGYKFMLIDPRQLGAIKKGISQAFEDVFDELEEVVK